jgi:pimeloyl-ACP methyl ester carboxylesterase
MLMATTIVMIHGAWVNGHCFDAWCDRYRAKGYECVTPPWPHQEGTVAELRATTDPELARVGVTEIVDSYEAFIKTLPEPPILMGHSFGGLFVQLLLDRGVGAVGVAIDPAPPRGILPGGKAIRANLPALTKWRGGHKVLTITEDHFDWGFANGMPAADRHAAWEEYTVPTPGRIFFQAAYAMFNHATRVHWHNGTRAPLLIIAGQDDRTVTAKMNLRNYRKYRHSDAVTDFRIYEDRSHSTILEPGWEKIADDALDWAEGHLPG